jgi:hypothetical protein
MKIIHFIITHIMTTKLKIITGHTIIPIIGTIVLIIHKIGIQQ